MFTERSIRKIYLMLGSACNIKCRHCYQTDVKYPKCKKVIHDDVWAYLSRISYESDRKIQLIFWGGEPLLYWQNVKEVVDRLGDGAFDYSVMSNGTILDDEKVEYLNKHSILFSVSNDGRQTASVRGINILNDENFCERFKRIRRKCIGAVTHAYNIDPYDLCAFVWDRVGPTPIHYQYTLECTFDMDPDLYDYDFSEFENNLERCRVDFYREYRLDNSFHPARFYLKRGVYGVNHYLERQLAGLNDDWYPTCASTRKNLNLDILGFVHACHNRESVIGRITEPYEQLLRRNEEVFKKGIEKKKECLSCKAVKFCRFGCPLNPLSKAQKICCEAEKAYWQASLETVNDFCHNNTIIETDKLYPKGSQFTLDEEKE